MAWTPKFTFSVTWDNITGKPLNYPTTWSMVGGKPSTFPSTWATVSGKPETATRWPTWGEVTGKPAIPSGTVTSVSAGGGMLFSTITGSGEVTLGYPSQVSPTSLSEVTSGSHSHSFTSLFSDTSAFTADHAPDQYPSSVVSLSRVGSLADTGWPSNGLAANFMSYGGRYGQLYFETNNNKLFFRTSNSNTSWTGDLEEVYHTGNLPSADTGDVPNTIMRRDSQGDAHARLFRSTFPSQSDLSSNASIAFRINDSDQNYIRFTNSPSALRSWLGLGSAATSNISDFASSSRFTYIGSVSGGSYYDYFPGGNAVSYFFHAAGNSPSDAPASPARQTAVLGMDTSWGTTQLAITNEDSPQVFVRANGVTSWNRVWTAADFDPSSKFDNPSGSTNQYIRGNGSLATFPSIPSSSDYVATSGNQSGLSGNKTWSGAHTWDSSSVTHLRLKRNSSNVNSLIQAETNRGSVYFGYGNASSSDHFAAGTSNNLTGSALFFYADSSGLVSSGTVSDSIGNVRKPEYRTANGTITLNSNDVNRIVEKSNNSSYTYTIPSGHGSHGDIITFVNSGTSGTLTINAATGVTIYRNGTSGNISVGPGSTVTIYRSATANRWIA